MTRLQLCCTLPAVLLSIACNQTVQMAAQSPSAAQRVQHVNWAHYFLFGFVGSKALDTRDYCETTSVASVEISTTIATLATTIGTAGVYCPRRVSVTCTEGKPQ